ncbi:FUSC family protein [Actinoallomurus sp. CA-150999]|uniref:FUSC family protein n=1 Tax=Actinoallomurus sp. CA-150999 TaxID=3239887 RepID=UPI003D8F77FA
MRGSWLGHRGALADWEVRVTERLARLRPVPIRARSTVVEIVRLTVTAIVAYLFASMVLRNPRPVLAPLTALLVLRASTYQTLRSASKRVISVVAGVLVAVALVEILGFTWWSLGVAIGSSLVFGHLLRLGDHILEVPISAMLILSLDTSVAAHERVVDTLIGAGTGLLAGFVTSPVRLEPAEEAIEELGRRLADELERMAGGLKEQPSHDVVVGWLRRTRELDREIHHVDRALEEAEESLMLNPRALRVRRGVTLRSGLETLEHTAVIVRAIARSLVDHTRRADRDDPMWDERVRGDLAAALCELAAGVRTYGRLVRRNVDEDFTRLVPELERRLSAAGRRRNRLAHLLRTDAADWHLHGELVAHLDRLIDELLPEHLMRARRRRGTGRLRHPFRSVVRKPYHMRPPRTASGRRSPEEPGTKVRSGRSHRQ